MNVARRNRRRSTHGTPSFCQTQTQSVSSAAGAVGPGSLVGIATSYGLVVLRMKTRQHHDTYDSKNNPILPSILCTSHMNIVYCESRINQYGAFKKKIPAGARFSAPVQTGPGAHPASYTIGTGSFPGGRGVALSTHPI
jgi:hypothetical protein